MGKLKSESQGEIDDFLSDLTDDEIKILSLYLDLKMILSLCLTP